MASDVVAITTCLPLSTYQEMLARIPAVTHKQAEALARAFQREWAAARATARGANRGQ